ncbi:phosphotransferase [Rugosimonospora acidiphila]|uniref:Phosphotransferase n=2 Tax=Rugosimonospora acidiphila TaxID=556531 RepID=A0ABP9STY9_9ACTN
MPGEAIVAAGVRTGNPAIAAASGAARVGSHLVRERLQRPRAAGSADIPVSDREITSEWLTAVLCAEHPGAAVESFVPEDRSAGTSTRWRFTVTYNEAGRAAGLPTRLFAKATRTFSQRLTLELAGILTGEPVFFKHLRPGLDIEAPHGYHAGVDLRSGRSISILEDIVATKGATFCTPATPISREQIEDLLTSMATWHGRYWNDPELERHPWLKLPSDHFYNLDKLVRIEKRAKVGARRAEGVIPEDLKSNQDSLYRVLKRSLEVASQGPKTLLHGDSHIGNTYLTSAGRMGFTDWQIVLRGSWAYDVAYTITSGLAVDDRRAWERELLAFYLERLEVASGGRAALDLDAAFLAYRQQSLYPYFLWLATIGRSPIQPKYQPDEVSRGIIERTAMAVRDLDVPAALGGSS